MVRTLNLHIGSFYVYMPFPKFCFADLNEIKASTLNFHRLSF